MPHIIYQAVNIRFIISLIFSLTILSCIENNNHAIYELGNQAGEPVNISLTQWDIIGMVDSSQVFTILEEDSLIANPYKYKDDDIQRQSKQFAFNGFYSPLFQIVDLKEVYQISINDTLQGITNYMFCRIIADEDKTMYLIVRSPMEIKLWLNSKTLVRSDVQSFNSYKMMLKKGENILVMKPSTSGNNHSMETILCDECSLLKEYGKGQNGNIIYPIIFPENKTVMLTNAHQNVADIPAILSIHDVWGREIAKKQLQKDSFTYHIPELEVGISYICRMAIGETTMTQAVLCGTDDRAYEKFAAQRALIDDKHHFATQIDELLHRLYFLLHHETRYAGDWWWQFKVTPLTYQLEQIFAHPDEKTISKKSIYGTQYMSYSSELDGGIQRYVLFTPDRIADNETFPLVVIIRPHIVNHRHFFTSPQVARQWALNEAQALANEYRYIVIMPEARTYMAEDLMPIAEAEIKQAINNVSNLYSIDKNRIYLHANCTGGHRALKMAVLNPDMFAAIALYAPTYHFNYDNEWSVQNSPAALLGNLKHTPVFIHYDPLDTHSPYILFKDLIRDCRKKDIPLTLSAKKYTGESYNIRLVGEEAFSFFKDKSKKTGADIYAHKKTSPPIIADIYAKPFVYVYNINDKTEMYKAMVDSIKEEYDKYFFTNIPLMADTEINKKEITEKNLFLIGENFNNTLLNELTDKLSSDLKIDKKQTNATILLSVHINPMNKDRLVAIYRTNLIKNPTHGIHCPWKNGTEATMSLHL